MGTRHNFGPAACIFAGVLLVVFISAAQSFTGSFDETILPGAWLQEGAKWENAPPDINPHLQSAQVEVLYFAKDRSFAIIDCTVGREPGKYEVISHGDPKGIYRGEWRPDGDGIEVVYRLEFRTIRIQGQRLPGPVYRGSIKLSGALLNFNHLTFRRDSSLDASASETLRGGREKPIQ